MTDPMTLRTRGDGMLTHAQDTLSAEAELHHQRDTLQLWHAADPAHPDGLWHCHLHVARPRGAPALHASGSGPTRDSALDRCRSDLFTKTAETHA